MGFTFETASESVGSLAMADEATRRRSLVKEIGLAMVLVEDVVANEVQIIGRTCAFFLDFFPWLADDALVWIVVVDFFKVDWLVVRGRLQDL